MEEATSDAGIREGVRMDILWILLVSLTVIIGSGVALMVYVQSNYREALKRMATGKPQEALDLFMKVVGWQGKHVPSLWQLALLNLSMNKPEAGVKNLQKILAIMEKEPDKEGAAARWEVTESQVISKLAWTLAQLNKRSDAIRYFRRLIELEPNNKEAKIESGKLLYSMREYDQCIQMFESVIPSDPKNSDIYEHLSNALSGKGEPLRAAEALEKRLAGDRTNVNLWIRLANLYRAGKNNAKQAEAWRQVTEITPQDDPNHVSAVVQLGKIAFIEGTHDRAIEHLRRADSLCPHGDTRTLKSVKYYLGRALLDSERRSEALQAISEVYEIDPNYKDVRDLLRDSLELLSDDDLSAEVKKMRSDKFSQMALSIVQLLGYRAVTVETVNQVDLKVDARLEETGKDRNVLLYFERGPNGDVGELAIRSFLIECDEKHIEHPVFLTTGGFTFEAQMKGKDHRMRLMPKHDFCDLIRKTRTAA